MTQSFFTVTFTFENYADSDSESNTWRTIFTSIDDAKAEVLKSVAVQIEEDAEYDIPQLDPNPEFQSSVIEGDLWIELDNGSVYNVWTIQKAELFVKE